MVGQPPVKLFVYCAFLLLVWSRGLGTQLTWCYSSGASELWGVQRGGGFHPPGNADPVAGGLHLELCCLRAVRKACPLGSHT